MNNNKKATFAPVTLIFKTRVPKIHSTELYKKKIAVNTLVMLHTAGMLQ